MPDIAGKVPQAPSHPGARMTVQTTSGPRGGLAGTMSVTIDGKRVPLTPDAVRRATQQRERRGDSDRL